MSSAADPTAPFLDALRASGLLTPQQLHELAGWVAQTHPDLSAVAKEVNRRGWMTMYQLREVAHGRSRDLTLDRYVLLDLLGEGGMGRVYKAHDTRLGRDVALKIIRGEKLKHPAAAARFRTEIEAVGRMRHPNVVTAFDAQVGSVHFCVMELIDGTDLTRLVRERGPLPVAVACEYVRQAALGLHHAFEQGMVHRDIKPSNLLVTRDGRTVKLVDLGLARLDETTDGGNKVTQDGFVLGTPDFLAPEQARNPHAADIRADIYALGATLFYLLTGRVPFEGASPTEKILKHCTEPPPALGAFRPDAPPQIGQIIHWCMAKRPEERPQTPLQLALALQPFCPAPRAGTAPMPAPYPQPAAPLANPPTAYPQPVLAAEMAVEPEAINTDFQMSAQTDAGDPIRRRAKSGSPVGLVLGTAGALLLLGLCAYGVYRALQSTPLGPVESFTNTIGMKLVKIDGGAFLMGSPANEPGRPEGKADDESPVHEVTISGPFLASATEVTHSQYARIMGSSPAGSVVVRRAANASDMPADAVSYVDAVEFCRKLTENEKGQPHTRPGWAYRLPTEAEWEYICRAGTDTPFWTGTTLLNRKQALFNPAPNEAESGLDGGSSPAGSEGIPGKVAHFSPNPWGIYDTHGNIAEWCQDWYKAGYPEGRQENPTGPASGSRRVVRGGSFKDPASVCRSAARAFLAPEERRPSIGFRVVYAPVMK